MGDEIKDPFSVSDDTEDKRNPHIQFIPPVEYTPEQVKAGNKLVEIINHPELSETEKKDAVWQVLKNC